MQIQTLFNLSLFTPLVMVSFYEWVDNSVYIDLMTGFKGVV